MWQHVACYNKLHVKILYKMQQHADNLILKHNVMENSYIPVPEKSLNSENLAVEAFISLSLYWKNKISFNICQNTSLNSNRI